MTDVDLDRHAAAAPSRFADAVSQVLRRGERGLPTVVGLLSLVVGIVVLVLAGAPRPVTALVVAQALGLLAVGLARLVTKASMHTAVVAAGAAVLWLEPGFLALDVGLVATAVAGWARVRRGRRSTVHVLLGTAIGCAVCMSAYGSLRG